jgi:large subunit ribosomal protein L30
MGKLKITLDKGYSGRTERQRQTLRGLGLTKREKTVVRDDSPAIRGMVEKVSHLVSVEEVAE